MKTPDEWAHEFTGGQHRKLIAEIQADAREELMESVQQLSAHNKFLAGSRDAALGETREARQRFDGLLAENAELRSRVESAQQQVRLLSAQSKEDGVRRAVREELSAIISRILGSLDELD